MAEMARIYTIVRSIPKGMVLTYGDVASLAKIRSPRYVGYALHHNPDQSTIPCHRVVNFQGKTAKNFAFGLADVQQQLLENEGVQFVNGRVDMEKYRWIKNIVS